MQNSSFLNFPVVKNEAMKNVYKIASKASKVDFPVLIQGETGVGKEVLANYIHQNSVWGEKGNFVSLNCAAIQDNLIESELFGHVKGSFTGADKNKTGLIKIADKGTLFLDEIGEMSLDMQKKLLRVLESGEFFPVGSVNVEKSNFRLISATNLNLKKRVSLNNFRVDLYHRINVITIRIPPIKERVDEIPQFTYHFLNLFGCPKEKLSIEVMDAFLNYPWPGNIRELRNVIASAIAMLDESDDYITLDHLPADRFGELKVSNNTRERMTLKEREINYRRSIIKYAMDFYKGDYKKVMTNLKVSKDIIYRSLNLNGKNFVKH